MTILRAREPFSITFNGTPRGFVVGDLIDSEHPIVQGREHLFEPVETFSLMPSVEQATAAPGEKRSRTRPAAKKAAAPRKRAAKKAAAAKPAAKAEATAEDAASDDDPPKE